MKDNIETKVDISSLPLAAVVWNDAEQSGGWSHDHPTDEPHPVVTYGRVRQLARHVIVYTSHSLHPDDFNYQTDKIPRGMIVSVSELALPDRTGRKGRKKAE